MDASDDTRVRATATPGTGHDRERLRPARTLGALCERANETDGARDGTARAVAGGDGDGRARDEGDDAIVTL